MATTKFIIADTWGNVTVYSGANTRDADVYDFYQGDDAAMFLDLHNLSDAIAGVAYPVILDDDNA